MAQPSSELPSISHLSPAEQRTLILMIFDSLPLDAQTEIYEWARLENEARKQKRAAAQR
jgi:hypothetical protein